MQSNHCIVFVTNIETSIIYRHFLRLQSETDSMLDTFLCVNESPPLYWASERQRADFRFSLDDVACCYQTDIRNVLSRAEK